MTIDNEQLQQDLADRRSEHRRMLLKQAIEESSFFDALDGMWQEYRVAECMANLLDRIEEIVDGPVL